MYARLLIFPHLSQVWPHTFSDLILIIIADIFHDVKAKKSITEVNVVNPAKLPEPHFFAALPLPPECKAALAGRMESLRAKLSFGKWSHPEDLHLTLMFLGPIAGERKLPVREALAAAAARHAPFPLAVKGLGSFGLPQAPRVLYAEADGDRDALARLAADASLTLSALGFAADSRPYSPHITLARRYAGSADPSRLIRAEAEREWALPLRWTADSVVLYRSHPGQAPMYEVCASYPMRSEKSGKTTLFSER